jgi:hypothetical protein
MIAAFWAALLGLLKLLSDVPCSFSRIQVPSLDFSIRGIGWMSPEQLQMILLLQTTCWWWCVADQWLLYRGPIISIGAAVVILAAWHQLRLRRLCSLTAVALRDRWVSRLFCLRRSLLTAAALWILAYLWLAPTTVQCIERDYQINLAHIEKAQEHADALKKTMTQLRNEQSWRKGVQPGERKAK